ncbi:deoxycytidine triphosphate deaminase [Patescibacteria group bacterium]|nr:deoxycytidine triphosphate deaminase [Patescibacteria group bacterium]
MAKKLQKQPKSPKPPMRSLLSKDMILHHRKIGNIFIFPFNKQNLGTTSYDARLGENFFQEQPFRTVSRRIFNPFNPEDIKRYWGEPQKAVVAKEWMKENGPLVNIRPDDKIIILGPGETILAHTEEFIGGRNCVTTEMRARSSMGRIGITVCKCAGWGDLGFCNRWTMEMSNHLKDTPVILVVGMRVAQIAFYQVDSLAESYAKTGGQYQATDDTGEMIRNWSPDQMLPRFSRGNY